MHSIDMPHAMHKLLKGVWVGCWCESVVGVSRFFLCLLVWVAFGLFLRCRAVLVASFFKAVCLASFFAGA
jgi:hypothetical protein